MRTIRQYNCNIDDNNDNNNEYIEEKIEFPKLNCWDAPR